jgi:hypothetical protein
MKLAFYNFFIVVITLIISSCRKFVDIPLPINQLSTSLVFNNDSSAVQAIKGIYSEMMNSPSQFSNGYMTYYGGLAADELYYYTAGGARDEFLYNEISPLITAPSHPFSGTPVINISIRPISL